MIDRRINTRVIDKLFIWAYGWFFLVSFTVGQTIIPTIVWTDFYSNRTYINGVRAPIGTLIQAYDPDGILCGEFSVAIPGWYGYLHVYGDELETTVDEGAMEGDSITFKIAGEEAVGIGNLVWQSGNPGAIFKVDLYVGGFPPIIEDFPEQISFLERDSAQIHLNSFVFDQDNTGEELFWSANIINGIAISVDIDSTTQVATLTSPPTLIGTAEVEFTVEDPTGFSDSIQVTVLVLNLENDPPVITSPTNVTAIEDEMFVYHATAEDPDGPEMIFIFENLSEWLTASQDSVYGIPTEGILFGNFRIIASDMELTDTLDVLITVIPVNDPPSPFMLISPGEGDTVETLTVLFVWNSAYDPELETIEYILHLYGAEVDTTMGDRIDTTFIFDGNDILTYKSKYTWYVEATDGLDTTSSTTENTFWTPPFASVSEMDPIPSKFYLRQNYPNPFNLSTHIPYDVPNSSPIVLNIYDLTGKYIITLVNGIQWRGYRSVIWEGRDKMGRPVSTGIYLYQLKSGNFIQTRKMVLLK